MTDMIKIKLDALDELESNGIKLDASSIGLVLRRFVILGSEPGQLTRSDVIVRLPASVTEGEDVSTKALLDAGTSLFSALIYASANDRAGFAYKPAKPSEVEWTTDVVAQYIFISFFYILTQNQAVGQIETGANFVRKTIGSTVSVKDIDERLFEAGMVKIPHDWVRSIKISDLGQAARNRLALGIAGYRQLQLFFSISPKDGTPDAYMRVWKVVTESVNRGYFFGFHTHFRNEDFIRTFKSLNKTLLYVIYSYGKQDEIETAKAGKALYRDTYKEARYSDVSMITEENFKRFETDPIFG